MSDPRSESVVPDGDLTPALLTCLGCGDLRLEFDIKRPTSDLDHMVQCETCEQYDADERAAMKRAAVDAVMAMATPALVRRVITDALNRNRSDERDILCDGCSEVAASYDPLTTSVSALEGRVLCCEGCERPVKLYLYEPDDGDMFDASLHARVLKEHEL